MPLSPSVTGDLVVRVLVEGAVLALALIGIIHLLRTNARQLLFAVLLIAALAYVLFAVQAEAGAGWTPLELLGVVLYGTIGRKGLRGSMWWLAAGWALHPIWDIGLHYFGPGRSFVHPLRYPIPCVN